MQEWIREHVGSLGAALASLPVAELEQLGEVLYRAYADNKQVFTLGNGGSASNASHMAADLAKNTIGPNMPRFRILSLNDNVPLMTALANDLGYDQIFREQLVNLVQAGDVLMVISGSGCSPNVLEAMRYARERSAEVVALLGSGGGAAVSFADVAVTISSSDYGVIEDAHLVVNHILVKYFEARLESERPWIG